MTNLPSPPPAGADIIPQFVISGFSPLGNQSQRANQGTKQLLDTVTWTKGKHTMKFGADYRRLHSTMGAAFFNDLEGSYTFNGSVMSALLGGGAATPLASFLLGYPDNSTIATTLQPNVNATAQHYATFAQDDWKVSSRFTLNFGLRWEYHPAFRDAYNNLANFDYNYSSVVNGVPEKGAIFLPGPGTLGVCEPGLCAIDLPHPDRHRPISWPAGCASIFPKDGLRAADWIRLAHFR